MRLNHVIWALALGGLLARSAEAQSTEGRGLDGFQVNQRIKVSVAGAQLAGTFQGIRNDSLTLVRDGVTKRLALTQVLGVWRRGRSTKAGAIVGGIVGAGAGVFVGLVGAAVSCDDGVECSPWSYPIVGGLVGGGAGAGLGAIIGAAIPKWKRVPL